jgi:hydrogenase maturation protein HypF
LSDEPICTDEREALERLGTIADLFLVHNRPIARHMDDSIVRVMLDRELVLRRARGYAPLPVQLRIENAGNGDAKSEIVLAVGAHLKNSIALSVGGQVFISQHIGDLGTEPANDAFRRVIADFKKLYDARPEIVAADLHPDYLSTKFADNMSWTAPAERSGDGALEHAKHDAPSAKAVSRYACHRSPKLISVQHHVAHVLSCMAENEVAPPALGVSWDGTGLGTDGTIWGGEFFLVTKNACERVAHLRQFRLPGGDKAVKEPRRAAIGLLYEMFGETAFEMKSLRPFQEMSFIALSALKGMLQRKLNSPLTSSAGRLFDAVAALIGLRQTMRFEGQAAMELEFALDGIKTDKAYELRIVDRGSRDEKAESGKRKAEMILDWQPMIEAVLADVKSGVSTGEISAKFHNALAEAIVSVAKSFGLNRVVLSGGCFQNRYLTERTVHRLRDEKFQPCWHQRVPTNDGGIALGQIAAALRGQSQISNLKS